MNVQKTRPTEGAGGVEAACPQPYAVVSQKRSEPLVAIIEAAVKALL